MAPVQLIVIIVLDVGLSPNALRQMATTSKDWNIATE
jgi:hypothetical protein